MMERKVRLKTVNPCITCGLCKGYLIDATTITECLHTFCKSCLVKYLDEHNTCPRCHIVIHQSHPKNYISFDRTMQDIVFKLVPRLQEKELKKQQDFYRKRGLSMPNGLSGSQDEMLELEKNTSPQKDETDCHRHDEQLNICLECKGGIKMLKRKFLRLSSHATVTHLKKFVAYKIYNNLCRFKDVDILCNDEILGKDHTLKFVEVTRWRAKDTPLLLHYRQRVLI